MIQDLNSKQPLVSDIKLTWHAVLKKLNKELFGDIEFIFLMQSSS